MRRFALIKSSRKARYLHYPFSIFNSPFLFVCKNLSEVFVYKQTQTALIQLSHLTEHEKFILMVHTADGICGFRQAVGLARKYDCASRNALCALIGERNGGSIGKQAVGRQQKLLHGALCHCLLTLGKGMALRQLIRARTGALQAVQHGQRTQLFAKVIDQCADIGALADLAPQRALLGILVEVQQLRAQ